jgi:N-acetylmuramoyl-L-alanine amidase
MAIVNRVGQLIRDSMRGVQVIYTRTTDFKVPLAERHEIANRAEADVFVSVHINSTAGHTERIQTGHTYVGKGKKRRQVPTYKTIRHRETSTSGTETLVIGNIRQGEKAEAIGEYGEAIVGEPGLMNPNDPQTAMIVAQYSAAFLGRSVALAQAIQDNFAAQGRRDLGVKQQSLQVLAGSAMPGVLVECGFINNPQEEVYMNSEVGQREIAYAIFLGLKRYKQETERQQ